MPERPAGQYARSKTTGLKTRWIAVVLIAMVAPVAVVLSSWPPSPLVLAFEAAALGVIVAVDRFAGPVIQRWGQGARGEEHVGALLEELRPDGWLAVHDVYTGRGNIDSVVAGPGGVFTIEVKSTRGRLDPRRLHPRTIRQAHAQRCWLERVIQRPVTALVVFSDAYLIGRGITQHAGVRILTARMLVAHLRRQHGTLTEAEVRRIAAALV